VETAKVFWSGRSQAVRLPKRYRIEGSEVRISRRGNLIVLEPIPESWAWLDSLSRPLDEDFVRAVEEQPVTEERPELDRLFP
jgi:antitoxin VapB